MTTAPLPTLYVLAEDYRNAVISLADLDLPPEVVADTLESMIGDIEVKSTNVAMFVRNLEATAEQIKAAEAEMAKRRKAIETRTQHVRDYLKDNMLRAGINKIECPYFKLAIRDNPPAVVIDDQSMIPANYMRQPETPPPAPDKKAIGDALKAGVEIKGARLERGQRLEIK